MRLRKKQVLGGNETPIPQEANLLEKVLMKQMHVSQHAEDIVFWEGSKGAMRALEALRSMAKEDLKMFTRGGGGDGSHRIFGRDENGEFVPPQKRIWKKGRSRKSQKSR